MAKKNDAFYYDSFAKAAELACKAAEKLDDVMRHSTPPRSRTPSPRCTRSSRAPTKLSTRSTMR